MRSLVLGGNGFIGTHLVDALVREDHAVRVFDRSPNVFRDTPTGVEYVPGNLGDHDLVREAVAGAETVFHLASTTLPENSNEDPAYDVRSNLVDSLNLFEACASAGVRKVVFASSGGTVYGPPQTTPIREDHPTDPITSYGVVKLAIEKYLGLFRHLHDLDYAVLRISNLYGPYQSPARRQGAVAVFLHRLHTDRSITIWGDGGVVRDYLYVADLVDALKLAAATETRAKVLNIGSGRGASLNDLISLMAEVTGERPHIEYRPSRALDVPMNVLDTRLARRELNWSPSTDLPKGLARTWAWIQTLAPEPDDLSPSRE